MPILEGPVHAELYGLALGSTGIGLSVEFANDTDYDQWLRLDNARIGDQSVDFHFLHGLYLLPAHSVLDTAFSINYYALDEGTMIHDLSFEFDWHDGRGTVSIGGLDGVYGSDMSTFYTPDVLQIEPAHIGS